VIHHIIKPCSTKAAFEIVLDKKYVEICMERAQEKGFEKVADTPFVKIFRREIKLSFFKSGKILVEGLESKEEVETFFSETLA
jgi:ribonuclease HIII